MWLLLPALIQQWNNYTDHCFFRTAFQAACDRPHYSPHAFKGDGVAICWISKTSFKAGSSSFTVQMGKYHSLPDNNYGPHITLETITEVSCLD